jgi:mannitol/fructose-specific phosphotransferase system IIA component (Ntr-type)
MGVELELKDMVTESIVACQIAANNRDDVIEKIGTMMQNAGVITSTYIAAMKKVIEDLGPYIVIAPGIALLHARPEDGVLKPCLAVMTLSTPVPFNHSQNDPVEIVFGLGAVDKQSHINALSSLAKKISDTDFIKSIRSSKSKKELFLFFQK